MNLIDKVELKNQLKAIYEKRDISMKILEEQKSPTRQVNLLKFNLSENNVN
jgi:hypothetical protein